MAFGNPSPSLGHSQHVERVKVVIGISARPLLCIRPERRVDCHLTGTSLHS